MEKDIIPIYVINKEEDQFIGEISLINTSVDRRIVFSLNFPYKTIKVSCTNGIIEPKNIRIINVRLEDMSNSNLESINSSMLCEARFRTLNKHEQSFQLNHTLKIKKFIFIKSFQHLLEYHEDISNKNYNRTKEPLICGKDIEHKLLKTVVEDTCKADFVAESYIIRFYQRVWWTISAFFLAILEFFSLSFALITIHYFWAASSTVIMAFLTVYMLYSTYIPLDRPLSQIIHVPKADLHNYRREEFYPFP
ncbi:hypothetical protein SNEBB_007218 [Seison nebaliae]|nr:hypothetical protein SNEBB_007218 [Seison nebaliae]